MASVSIFAGRTAAHTSCFWVKFVPLETGLNDPKTLKSQPGTTLQPSIRKPKT